jgi:hypothetical protein
VLLDRGYSGIGSETFNPATTTFTFTPAPVVGFRARHTATLLTDGTVFIAGGSGNPAATTAEIFSPGAGTFANAGNLLTPRVDHTATLLADGSVLLAGGLDDTAPCCHNIPPQSSMERYVPGTGIVGAGSMLVERYVYTSTALADGTALLAGTWGWSNSGGRSAEIYDPATAVALASTAAPIGHINTPYAGFTLSGLGGTGAPYSITRVSGDLPAGLIYNSVTRSITGTPTQSGTFGMTFSVADVSGNTNWQTVTVRIDPLTVSTTSLADGHLNVAYNQSLTGTGIAPLSWLLVAGQGSLPTGLTLNANGTITGTPTQVQFTSFTVRVTDALGQVAEARFNLNVTP